MNHEMMLVSQSYLTNISHKRISQTYLTNVSHKHISQTYHTSSITVRRKVSANLSVESSDVNSSL